ncbi:MAG: ATP-binding protein [Rhodocyclaceae bacterium]|nr:ATP-binding protein [Rhodocyclaceae bacterium]MDZ4213211.1 ATP-binding protein [Rhodocyclaceae bacterium]
MITRHAAPRLIELAGYYPIVAITGPRQSGKTTLVRATFPDKPYASLEDPDVRALATTDPRGFLAQYPDGAIIDEVQRAPNLLSYLQTRVDNDRRTGLFVLTGSQQFGLMERISQSLAGRVGLLHLLPFAFDEITAARPTDGLEDWLWLGFYPPLHDRAIPPHVWFSDYLATYVERDVRSLLQVRDLDSFHRFVLMCAARSGQLLNLSALAADCGVTHNTAHAWIGVLEASYIVMRLTPFHRNFGKRLTKTPKLYFLDPGLAAWLTGVRGAPELTVGSLRGPLFETWVVSEFVKRRRNALRPEELHFWRDSTGNEVDLLVTRGEEVVAAVECKSGRTVAEDWFPPLERFTTLAGTPRRLLIHGGEADQPRTGTPVFGWRSIGHAMDLAFG